LSQSEDEDRQIDAVTLNDELDVGWRRQRHFDNVVDTRQSASSSSSSGSACSRSEFFTWHLARFAPSHRPAACSAASRWRRQTSRRGTSTGFPV